MLHESVGAEAALLECVKRSRFKEKRREYARWNWRKDLPTWRGIGLALVHHGSGFTGSGEVHLASQAAVALTRDGEIRVLSASTEFGQGTNTMFAQVAADTLGVPFEWISVETPDTSRVPDSGPTVASRTCMVVGRLVRQAALQLKDALLREHGHVPHTRKHLLEAAHRLCGDEAERRFEAQYERPAGHAVGRRHVPRRRLRGLQLRRRRGGPRGRQDHLGGEARRASPRSRTSARRSTRCSPRAR